MTSFLIPEPDLQIEFYHRLEAIRESWLIDALLATVSRLEIPQIDRELAELVSPPAMQEVAGWGLRGEVLFAVPCVLESNPALLGYYRLLLGFSQKQFYGDRYGIRPFKGMEDTGQLSAAHRADLRRRAIPTRNSVLRLMPRTTNKTVFVGIRREPFSSPSRVIRRSESRM